MTPDFTEFERRLIDYFERQEGCRCVDLDRFVGGKLSEAEREAVEIHLSECESCRRALDGFEAVGDIWREESGDGMTPLWARLCRWLSTRRVMVPVSIAAVGFLLSVVFWPRHDANIDFPLNPKGGFNIHVAVDRGGKGFLLKQGDSLKTGDRLGFFYTATYDGFLTILYGDSRGRFIQLYPTNDLSGAPARAGNEIRLPDGALISPGEGCEWVVGLFSARKLAPGEADTLAKRMWQGRRGCHPGDSGTEDVEAQVIGVVR